jgi:hypothetical protein
VREAEKALKQSIRRGKILDPTTIPKKIEQYFDKNWNDDEEHIKIREIPSDIQNNNVGSCEVCLAATLLTSLDGMSFL